jgi:hypothetical protein
MPITHKMGDAIIFLSFINYSLARSRLPAEIVYFKARAQSATRKTLIDSVSFMVIALLHPLSTLSKHQLQAIAASLPSDAEI